MKTLVDVVNFNADASCLSSERWLGILQGGGDSEFVRWLRLYIECGKKVVLGFPGATVADVAYHNPEAIKMVNEHPDIFEIILRPFAHDIALLRLSNGFQTNLDYGIAVIRREFAQVRDYFLPPEFMLTNEQIVTLQARGVSGIFINPARFSSELKNRIPTHPYLTKGLFGITMPCIPVCGALTNAYLYALQMYDCSSWNAGIATCDEDVCFVWRDGESSFLLPQGLDRELSWLQGESSSSTRRHLAELEIPYLPIEELDEKYFRSYPVHSFSAWMKEFRMLGYLDRVRRVEEQLASLNQPQILYWMMTINSDILSSIEKRSPVIVLKESLQGNQAPVDHQLLRSERGFEGEEYLAALEQSLVSGCFPQWMSEQSEPHLRKLMGRLSYVLSTGSSRSTD